MINYPDYVAACERLKNDDACFLAHDMRRVADKYQDLATVYDAERDTTPVDAAWLREIGLEALDEGMFSKGMLQVLIDSDCTFGLCFDGTDSMVFRQNPTRGDVLTALRLFSKGGAK